MRYCFISFLLVFSATSYAQYNCGGEIDLTDTPFSPYELVLIKANYPEDGFGIYRLQNRSEDNIIVDGYFDVKESISNLDKDYYLHPKHILKKRILFWRLKIKEPNKGWHYLPDQTPFMHGHFPSDELIIEPGKYADLIGKIPHDKEEYIEHTGFNKKYKDYLHQENYQDYAYRIEYETRKGHFLLSTPYCLRP